MLDPGQEAMLLTHQGWQLVSLRVPDLAGFHFQSHHVKRMAAFSKYYDEEAIRHWLASLGNLARLTQRTVVTRKFARGTGTVKLNPANTTDFIFRHIPVPSSNSIPLLQRDLHDCRAEVTWGRRELESPRTNRKRQRGGRSP